jgi:phosphohistidine phosphatase SixA
MYSSAPPPRRGLRLLLIATVASCATAVFAAPMISSSELVDALRQGGYVLVMRHANSPSAPPDKSTADAGNTALERQLDDKGRSTASAMGKAIKLLRVPVGEVYSSPTWRAREAARLADLDDVQTIPELDEAPHGMSGKANAQQAAWLRAKASQRPRAGTNSIIVTHMPNIVGAFGQDVSNIAAGEALVFQPDGKGGTELIARIKIEEWPILAVR